MSLLKNNLNISTLYVHDASRPHSIEYCFLFLTSATFRSKSESEKQKHTEKLRSRLSKNMSDILESSNNVIKGQPFDDSEAVSPVWADFQKKVTALDLPEDETARLVNAGRTALIDAFKPAYQRFIAVIEKQSESASPNDGVWRLPDGEAF